MEVKIQRADGLRECRRLLTLAKAGKFDGYLLEGMACPGGCVAGAGTIIPAEAAKKQLDAHAKQATVFSCAESPYRHLPGCWKNRRHAKKKRNDERSSLTRC